MNKVEESLLNSVKSVLPSPLLGTFVKHTVLLIDIQ